MNLDSTMANQQNPLLPLPGHPGGPMQHRTFASYYADPAIDPNYNAYPQVLARFDPEQNAATSYVHLAELIASNGSAPQAYLCCFHRQNRTKVHCFHLPSRFPSSLTGNTTPWDGQLFAYLGEVLQGMVTTIQLPATLFQTVHNVRVKTSDYMVAHLNEMTDYGLPPGPNEEDAESTLVTTRQVMYLPMKYVPLFLNPAGYTLQEVWGLLYPALVEADDLQSCQTLLNWLRVASTHNPGQNPAAPSAVVLELTIPLVDELLITHRTNLLKQILPALHKPQESFEMALTQMAAAVLQNTNETRIARDEKLARAEAPKLPSDKYTGTINILLEYLQIPDERNLPQLWHRWANCPKRQEFQVLSDVLYSYTRTPEAFNTCAPVVNSKLLQDLQAFTFVGDSMDDIKTGIQPFIIADGSAEHRQANLEVSRLYGLLSTGDQALMLADLENLKAKEVSSIPLNYFELERNLGMFGTLLGTTLGNAHPLTVAYRAFWDLLSRSFRNEIQQIIDTKGYIKPAHVLRSVQLICYTWFTQRRNKITPPNPDFASLLYMMTLNTYMLPHLPPSLYKLAYPRDSRHNMAPSLPNDTPSLTGSSGSSRMSGASDGASTVSGLSVPTALITTGSPQVRKGAWIANLQPDPSLQNIVDSGMKLKDVIGSAPPQP
jgi:hypothetical protein